MLFVFLCAILAGAAIPTLAQTAPRALPTIDEIVARHIQATGGSAAWQKLVTQTRKGVALPEIANLPLESSARAPDQWTYAIRLPNGRAISHGFDGVQGWEDRGTAVKMGRDAVLEEALIYNPFWVLKLRHYFPEATLKGIERNGDTEVYVIEATPPGGRQRMLFFDVHTGLLTRAGKTMYADYRDAGGLKVPFLVRYGSQTLKFQEIRHGEPVDEARFRMRPVPPPAKPDAPNAPHNLPGVVQILDKYLDAIGGEQAFERVKSQIRKGALKEDAQSVPVETFAKAPGKWLLLLHTGGASPDREGYSGAGAWSESSDVIKDMNPREQPELETFLDCQLPLTLNRLRPVMTVKKKEKRGQQEVYVIEAAPAESRRRTLAFDAQTGLLTQADSVVFEDYRDVDGLKVPFTVKLHGGHLAVHFTAIKHNVPIEDVRFERPSPGPGFLKNFAGLKDARALPVLQKVIGRGVSPSDGRMLHDIIVENGYKRALDIGTAEGYSALWFGLAMKTNGGQVITIEIDPETADQARENIRQAGLSGTIDSRINDALLEIPALKGDFDFVFIDPGVPLNKQLFALLQSRILPGGAIAAHNASSFESQQPDFLKAIKGDPNFETKIVQTARGGILISTKKK